MTNRLLYVGTDTFGTTSEQRARALGSLGFDVTFVSRSAFTQRSRLLMAACHRLYRMGLSVRIPGPKGINAAIYNAAKAIRPQILWLDKATFVQRTTLEAVKADFPNCGVIGFSPDDMGGRHNRSKDFDDHLSLYDAFLTTKSFNVAELRNLGCTKVIFVPNGYDPHTHRHLLVDGSIRQRLGAPVSFIGAAEAARAASLRHLANSGLQVRVWGPGWKRWKGLGNATVEGRAIYGHDYAKAICASDVNLGFLCKGNRDLQTTRSIEIPACGAFLLAERTSEHLELFEEGIEAEFFGSDDELLDKCRYYLLHGDRRSAIAQAGRRRCLNSGYDYASRLRIALRTLGILSPSTDH